jgi:hypothetical protein
MRWDSALKLKYWRGFQAINGWKRAPVLEFALRVGRHRT